MASIINFVDYKGSIKVDNVEAAAVSRHQLRSRITTLTSSWLELPGTIEQNLMPWRLVNENEDHINPETVKKVLVDTGLWSYIQNAGGLSMPAENADFSSGQRTQFSMARLILHHLQHQNKVVMMDDPMATLNAKGREKACWLVAKYFGDSTVLMFCRDAHSLEFVDVVHSL